MTIIFRGWAPLVCFADYFGTFFLLTRWAQALPEKQQFMLVVALHIGLTVFNALFAFALNRKEVKHAVFGLRLELFVLAVGALLLLVALAVAPEVFGQR